MPRRTVYGCADRAYCLPGVRFQYSGAAGDMQALPADAGRRRRKQAPGRRPGSKRASVRTGSLRGSTAKAGTRRGKKACLCGSYSAHSSHGKSLKPVSDRSTLLLPANSTGLYWREIGSDDLLFHLLFLFLFVLRSGPIAGHLRRPRSRRLH